MRCLPLTHGIDSIRTPAHREQLTRRGAYRSATATPPYRHVPEVSDSTGVAVRCRLVAPATARRIAPVGAKRHHQSVDVSGDVYHSKPLQFDRCLDQTPNEHEFPLGYLVSGRKPPLSHEICDEPPHFRRGFGHGTGHTDTTEGCSASNRSTFSTSGHRRPLPSRCAERGGRNPQEMAAVRQRGVFDVVRPHACAVAQADRCGAGSRPVSTMQRCVQTHRRRGSAPGRDRDAQGC